MQGNAATTSSSVVLQLGTLLVGGGITLIVTVLSKHVWQYIQRPKLHITNVKQTAKEEEADLHVSTYMVYVKNTGRTAAKNCKPRVRFKGNRTWDDRSGGAEVNIDAYSCWSEARKPSRITINKGETVPLDVFRVYEDYRDGTMTPEEDRKVRFPSTEGWESYSPIEFRHSDLEVARAEDSISKGAVEDTNWQEAYIEVTAENADKAKKDIDLHRISGASRIGFVNASGDEEDDGDDETQQ